MLRRSPQRMLLYYATGSANSCASESGLRDQQLQLDSFISIHVTVAGCIGAFSRILYLLAHMKMHFCPYMCIGLNVVILFSKFDTGLSLIQGE